MSAPVAFFVIAVCATQAFACPFCKDSVSCDKPTAKTAESAGGDFNASIYAMLAGLAGAGGFTGVAMYKAIAKDVNAER
jgi:hypothetical protein